MIVVPTFLLRSVDPVAVLEAYQRGEYKNVTQPPSSKVSMSNGISLAPSYGSNPESEIYTYRNKSNNQIVVVTTNHQAYTAHINGEVYVPRRCLWCRGPIEEPIGIPVRLTIDTEGVYHFLVDRPYYCSFECCFAEICLNNSRCIRDPLYYDSEQMLRLWFRRAVGDTELIAAPDWWLLDENGGPLSRKDWSSHRYTRMSGIITAPIKVTYSA